MNAGQICVRNVVTVREPDELTDVAQTMRERHVGYLVAPLIFELMRHHEGRAAENVSQTSQPRV